MGEKIFTTKGTRSTKRSLWVFVSFVVNPNAGGA